MIYFSVTCFDKGAKRLIISIPLFLGVLLLGANRVEGRARGLFNPNNTTTAPTTPPPPTPVVEKRESF